MDTQKKTIEIGDWNMNVSAAGSGFKTLPHGLSSTEWKTIRNISVLIRNNLDLNRIPLDRAFSTTNGEASGFIN